MSGGGGCRCGRHDEPTTGLGGMLIAGLVVIVELALTRVP